MNDIITNIQNAVLNQLEGATVIPWNNGGIQINVQDTADIAAVLACAADMMDEYGGDDIQITTNQKNFEVYIDICEREDDEDEEEWGEDELPHFKATEEEEVYDYTAGAKVEWNGKPAKVSRTEYIDGNWYMILRDLETEEEITVPLAEFNKIQPKNI